MRLIKSNITFRLAAMLVLLMAGLSPHAQTTEFTVDDVSALSLKGTADSGQTKIQPLETAEDQTGYFRIQFSKNSASTAPAYYKNGNNLRVYPRNTFTVTANSGNITAIAFTQTQVWKSATPLTADMGSLEYEEGKKDIFWSAGGEKTTSVVFTVNEKLFFTGFTIMLEGAGTGGNDPKVYTFTAYATDEFVGKKGTQLYFTDEKLNILAGAGMEYFGEDPNNPGTTLYKASATYESLTPPPAGLFILSGDYADAWEYVENGVYTLDGYSYTFGATKPVFVPDVYATRQSGTFYEEFDLGLSLSQGQDGTQIYYTLDGSEPTAAGGTLYTGKVTIPAGASVVLKAVAVDAQGNVGRTSTFNYTFVPTYTFTVRLSKPGAGSVYVSGTQTSDATAAGETVYRAASGSDIYLETSAKSGYKVSGISIDGEAQEMKGSGAWRYLNYTMPERDVVCEIDYVFDPESPGDPESSGREYTLTVLYNPVGAGQTTTYRLKEGDTRSIYPSLASGYKFVSLTSNGEVLSSALSSYYFTMPAADVALVYNCTYNPGSPGDPEQPKVLRPLIAVAAPAGAATFSYSSDKVEAGQNYEVYASPRNGYVITGWELNGAPMEEWGSQNRVSGPMPEAGATLLCKLAYRPTSPDNPGKNSFNPLTGHLVVDDFVPGNLGSAISSLLSGYDYSAVASVVVKGKVTKSDFDVLDRFTTLQSADMSRTNGSGTLGRYVVEGLPLTSLILPADISTIHLLSFRGCDNLVSLSLHAQTPPVCTSAENSEFLGFNAGNCVLRVPEESIELYKASPLWSRFADIVPLGDAVHVLEVQLPYAYRDGRLKNNRIDLINMATGRRQRYVVTDRPIYTFNGVQKDEQYMVLMTSETGLELARIENVIIPDADHAVAFTDIKEMVPVSARVLAPDGTDVTEQCAVEWFRIEKDGTRTYLRKGAELGKSPEAEKLAMAVTMGRDLALKYVNPDEVLPEVTPGMEPVTVSLTPLRATVVSGRVLDEDGKPLSTANVNISQRVAGRYDKSVAAKTDKAGAWTASVVDAPFTTVTYAAPECVNRTDTIAPDFTLPVVDLGDVRMSSNVGARIRLNLTYTPATLKGEAPEVVENYSDVGNVTFKVYNENKKRQHPVSVQYPTLIVLDSNIDADDVLTVTASSASGEFLTVSESVAAGADFRPEVSLNLVGKGGVRATYGTTDSPEVAAMLYSAAGKLVKRNVFTDKALTFTGVDAGDYTLVAMTRSDILNAAASLGMLDELGLTAGKDYAVGKVSVAHGVIAPVEFATVPSVDESLYSYTGSNTSFTPNKSGLTSGQYLTLRTLLDFKPIYRNRVGNVRIEYTLPEGCGFVESSVMKGSNKFGYDATGDKILVNFGRNYSEQLRFCVVPTMAGRLEITARAIFEIDGQTVSQPIGTAVASVKDFDFIVPGRTSYAEITATGTAPANSAVRVMQDGALIGEGKAGQGGNWIVDCVLSDTYGQKECPLQARITTPEGLELVSATRNVVFDGNAIMIDRVTMLTGSEEVVFDFNHRGNTKTYTWVDDRLFTFIVKLSDNKPEKVRAVRLYVKMLDGGEKAFNCYYSESRDAWLCVGNFTSFTAPVNVAVSVITGAGLVFDRSHFDANVLKAGEVAEEGAGILAEAQKVQEDMNALADADAELLGIINAAIDDWGSLTAEEKHARVAEYLAAAGAPAPDYTYDSSLLGDADEINRLLDATKDILVPVEDYDYSGFDALSEAIDKEAGKTDYLLNDLEFNLNTTNLRFESELANINYKEVATSEIDLTAYSADDIHSMTMDDGSEVKFITTESVVILYDAKSGKAWVFETETSAAGPMKAPADTSRLEQLISRLRQYSSELGTIVNTFTASIQNTCDMLRLQLKQLEKSVDDFLLLSVQYNAKARALEEQLFKLEQQAASATDATQLAQLRKQIDQVNHDRELFLRCAQKQLDKANTARCQLGGLRGKFAMAKGVLDKVISVSNIVWRLSRVVDWGYTGIQDVARWNRFIDSVPLCENNPQPGQNLKQKAGNHRNTAFWGYVGSLTGVVTSAGIAAGMFYISSNPALGLAVKLVTILGDYLGDRVYEGAKNLYDGTRNDSRDRLNACILERNALECMPEEPDDEFKEPFDYLPGEKPGDNRTEAGNDAEKRVIIDPAGYVYEGVPSNRVEGVQATVYYREEVENDRGDIVRNEVKWDAEEYAQENPLFTDENGMYAWDVPPGEWRVKFEKEGYNTTYSEWLGVPPPQLEVNVGITQNAQPDVAEVHAYAEGVDITFDKYMDPETLNTSNIFVTADGSKLNGTVELLNLESIDPKGENPAARQFASKARFVPAQPLSVTTGKVHLTVSRNVLSYAGIPMTQTYTQEIDVEKEVKEITTGDGIVKVLYGGTREVTVSVLPAEAGKGRVLRIANSSPQVAATNVAEVTLDANGQGTFELSGELPGSADLTFSLAESDKTGAVEVKVLTELLLAEKPTASRPSGSSLYQHDKVELLSEAKQAVIYFTTDGSDPADADGTRRKYSVPLVMDADMNVRAVAVVDGETSETNDFTFTVRRSAMEFRPLGGWNWISHNFNRSVAPAEIAGSNVKAILSQTDEVVRDSSLGLIGTLSELDAAHSYKVEAEGAPEVRRLEEYAYNPATPLKVVAGWNWLGYPVGQAMSVAEAFAGTDFNAGDIIVGQEASSQFNGSAWEGTLTTLKPGAGYMFHAAEDMEIAYNDAIVSNAAALNVAGIPYDAPWAADIRKYPKVMVLVAEVFDELGIKADDNDWYVGAFNGTECRGVGRWIGGKFMMNIFGNTGDDIRLRLVRNGSDTEIEFREALEFAETVVGSVINPYAIYLRYSGVCNPDASAIADGVRIADGNLVAPACDLLEVFDTSGLKVLSIAGYDGTPVPFDSAVGGVHVVSVRNGDNYRYSKIMVK